MKRQHVALAVWLVLPLAVVGALVWAIAVSKDSRDRMREAYPPVGAGANDTGGVNAAGEMLAGNKANHGTPEGRGEVAPETPPPTPAPEPSPAPVTAAPTPAAPAPDVARPTPGVVGDLRKLTIAVGPAGGASRELLVWLPPGYDEPKNAQVWYPVLYMHDGQNLFGTPSEAPGEWRMDETATELITKGVMRPTIIVGLPHAGVKRMSEYLPVDALPGVTPTCSQHVEWLLKEVVPAVDQAFRTRHGPEHRGIGGSSLGATAALEAVTTHPEVFGLLLAESLPLRSGKAEAWDAWTGAMKQWPKRAYLGIGAQELGPAEANKARNAEYVAAVRVLDERLKRAGMGPSTRLLVVEPTGEHNEAAWARRLPQALTFLFPPPLDTTK